MGEAVLVSAVILVLPWLAGGLAGISIERSGKREYRGESFIAFGGGSAFSLPLVGFLTWLMLEFGAVNLSYLLAGLSTVCALLCGVAILKARPRSWVRPTPWQNLGLVVVALQVLSCFWLAISSPLQGWDSLSHWGSQAQLIADRIAASTNTPNIADHSHPQTVSLVLAWGALVKSYIGQDDLSLNISSILWLLCFCSILASLFGWAMKTRHRSEIGLVGVVLVASIPLLQNHVVLIGYSEVFVTLFVIQALIFASSFIEKPSKERLACLSLSLLILVYLRNTALIYAGIMVLAMVATLLFKKAPEGRVTISLALLVIAGLAYSIACGWDINFRGLSYGYKVDTNEIILASTKHVLSLPSSSTTISILRVSIFQNESFGVLMLATMASLLYLISARAHLSCSARLVLWIWVGLACLAFFTLCVPHGVVNAMPDRDTFFSRSLLPFSVVSVILIITALAECARAESALV